MADEKNPKKGDPAAKRVCRGMTEKIWEVQRRSEKTFCLKREKHHALRRAVQLGTPQKKDQEKLKNVIIKKIALCEIEVRKPHEREKIIEYQFVF